VSAYRTQRKVFGVERTVLVTYNENLFVAQCQTLLREIAKRQQRLRELQAQLKRWQNGSVRRGKPPTVEGVRKKVNAWLKARHMKELFTVTVETKKRLPTLRYRFEHRAWQQLQKTLLGKTLIFTDNDDWNDAEIVRGYRAQHHVEAAFRQMKDPHHIALRPQHHWTDQKIEVHVFYCVLALLLISLLTREMHHRGITLSASALLESLGQIREVGVLYPPADKQHTPQLEMTVSSMSREQRTLYDTLDLARYLTP
jgi:transposase